MGALVFDYDEALFVQACRRLANGGPVTEAMMCEAFWTVAPELKQALVECDFWPAQANAALRHTHLPDLVPWLTSAGLKVDFKSPRRIPL